MEYGLIKLILNNIFNDLYLILMFGYCFNCLIDVFFFCNISDYDFFNVVNLKYNLYEYIIIRI